MPVPTAYAAALIPPPILTAQNGATAGAPFSVTNTPDDSGWRSAITGITVNGSPLTSAAYDTTRPGRIVFNSSQSPLLQTAGAKTIGFTANSYSADSVVQTLAAVPQSTLAGVSVSGGNLKFTFTNASGLNFTVRGTNDITVPRPWPVIGTPTENPPSSGHYQFTDPNPATNSALYYYLSQP